MSLRSLAFAALLVLPLSLPAQQTTDLPQLTREQQQLLNALPANQRQALMQQFRQAQGREAEVEGEAEPIPDGTRGRTEEVEDDPRIIVPQDTLIIDIRFLPLAGERVDPLRRPNILEGRHTVRLDREGQLDLPGLPRIPLAGLNSEQAALRLMAERPLQGLFVLVTRLTLQPVGREALEPFGYQIFSQTVNRQRASTSLPVPSNYRVGPGDTVLVNLFGSQTGEYPLTVGRDGRLQVPQIGPVAVAGMRFDEMKTQLEQRFRDQTIGVNASVSMGELRAIEVFVLGDVERPGNHLISSLGTVLHALYASGGITEIGSLRDVRVIRAGEVAGRFDLYQLLLHGRGDGDIRLEAGDLVFVPSTGSRAGVLGAARRPAWYELKGAQTLGTLLDYAGGATADGDLRRAQVQRVDADGQPRFVDVDLSTRAGRATAARDGDLLVINRITPRVETAVQMRGYFNLTGSRAWRAGMRIRDVIPDRSVLGADPDLDYALVVRQLPSGRGVTTFAFALRHVFDNPASADNMALQARDEILVFGFDEVMERRALVDGLVARLQRQATHDTGVLVTRINGAVRAPGAYPLTEGMRISDLVRAGGGLAQAAFMQMAELTRYDIAGGARRQIAHVELPLESALSGDGVDNIVLQAHDALTVKQIPMWDQRRTVELRGEVMLPGVYPVYPGETLAQVIDRAGGLTEFAHPQAALLTRADLREKEQEQMDRMIQRLEADIAAAAVHSSDAGSAQAQALATSLVAQLRETRPVGRLVIDLNALMANPGNHQLDVIASAGDVLIVPPRPQEVTIVGEVYFPTSHLHSPDLRVRDYLQRSGGLTQRADNKRIYVVRANGSVDTVSSSRLRRGSDEVFAGDTIVVPLDAERVPSMVRFMNISQILYQLGVAAAAWQTVGVF